MNSDSDTDSNFDLVVIGGGAAGFFAAITCTELSEKPRRILILEKGSDVLQKVKISGGGRCNVTHDCHDPREFAKNYPRGQKALPGPLHRWNAGDMIDWLEQRGIELKTEADGRMFPITDSSQTIIDCFLGEARMHNIEIRCRTEVSEVTHDGSRFKIALKSDVTLASKNVLIATGGVRTPSGGNFAKSFGHSVEPAAPSLFTFKIRDPRLDGLAGISVPVGVARIPDLKLENSGPILITHWGLSGPGILKLSSKVARDLQSRNYQFRVQISWTGNQSRAEISDTFSAIRDSSGRQQIQSHSQFSIPGRLWKRLCEAAQIDASTKWGNVTKSQTAALIDQLISSEFQVDGKSMNKDEFVTCGGITVKEVDFKTMQSRLQLGLYFAGEVLDIDGVTGGFNFQSAWTTGRICGESVAVKL
ncbi:NAD(P)/FAD-dependent oxidoreductase [Verrucomicrobiales bacterium]|nr:NAD(P)/FAD-dependent oxidoreductase [Verrucomicrobiales bacterium]